MTAAAFGDQRRVVVGPRRARQLEEALALGKALRGIGRGVQEDVPMIEGRHQQDVRDSSMPLPNTSPDMSPMPATVNSVLWVSMPISRKCRLTDSQAPRAVMPMALWS
jgi:hypothetical protein